MKIKKYLFAVLVVATLLCISFTGKVKPPHKLIPHKGMDDSIVFTKTTRDEITKRFGTDYKIKRVYGRGNTEAPGDTVLNCINQKYEKLGITFFYFAFDTSTLYGIRINKLYPAVTDKGLSVGKFTLRQVELFYGIKDWSFTNKYMYKEYPGISFHVPFNGKFPVSDAALKAAQNKKISEIDIYFGLINTNE